MDRDDVTHRYEDVLQNIEFAIVRTYRGHRDMSDYDVQRALEVLMDAYSGERIGPASTKLPALGNREPPYGRNAREVRVASRAREPAGGCPP